MGYYQKRTSPDLMDGIAVFVSNQRFNVANIEYIKFGEVLKDDRHNVAILVTLQCVITKQFIVVSNTHLLWNPKRGDIKINQLDVLFNRIENILKLRRITHSSLIMTGDFNISVNSYIYNYIINGRTAKPSIPLHLMSGQKQSSTNDKSSSTQFPQKFHSFSLKSAYHPHHDKDGDFISTYHHDGYSLVDFIFYGSLQSEQTLLECVKVLKPPPIISLSQLPNDRFPSDHLPQIAYFGFTSETTSSL
ncbi:Endonuclease/exonuclease/phosphatase [Globomyces pollinis-pini]|nr:Endonuclease/exonuclease/phosphatase [Globomyces pollinis-pini]